MEAVGRNRTDVSDQVIGEDGGRSEGQTADFQRQLLSFPLLHPLSNSTKQHKERHIVVWCQQEDDLLREQVGIHGTENWTRIAAQFKDKTGRQCRRRWFSYLNTECKKGGWSQEEDLILCEAQKIFGNRWTEIAKVVAGRTDNAVKNRFTTLSKKRTKNESASNENSCSLPPPDDDTCFSQAGCITSVPLESPKSFKKMRYQKLNSRGSSNITGGSLDENEREMRSIRLPLSVLVPKHHNATCLADPQHEAHNLMPLLNDENDLNESEGTFTNELNESEGTFTESSFAEISVLTQEGEPLGSFAQGVSADGSEHSLENAWKELKDYLVQNGDTGLASSETSLVDVVVGEGLADRSRSSSAGSHSSGRPSMIRDHSNFSREHNNTPPNASDAPADSKVFCVEESVAQRDGNLQIFRGDGEDARGNTSEDLELLSCSLDSDATAAMSSCDEPSRNIGIFSTLPNADPNGDSGTFSAFPNDYSSPLQTMPIFRPLSEENPSPKFSASERQFLLSALGLSPSPPSATNPGQQPSCKRALLHSL